MKKTLFIVLVIILTGCASRQQSETVKEEPTIVEEISAELAIMNIYDEIFNAYETLSETEIMAADFDRKFMSAEYLATDSIVRKIDEKYPGEIGFHDYDHWIQGNDWENLSYAIASISDTSDKEVMISMVIFNCGQEKPIKVKMLKENGEWKIADFIREGVSELHEMREYIAADETL
jgi:RNase P/RNase MRP subunit POP5